MYFEMNCISVTIPFATAIQNAGLSFDPHSLSHFSKWIECRNVLMQSTTWMQKICVEIMKMVLTKTANNKKVTENTESDGNDAKEQCNDHGMLNIDCSQLYLDGKFSSIYYLESMINNDSHYFVSYLHCTNKLRNSNPDHFLRFWKSHSFFSAFPTKSRLNGKYICVIRDSKDVVVSFYEYLKLIGQPVFQCDFNLFVSLFTAGCVPGGNV